MAKFVTFLDEGLNGASLLEHGWSARWDGINSSIEFQIPSGGWSHYGDGYALWTSLSTNLSRLLASWDEIDADTDRADVDVLVRVWSGSTESNIFWPAVARASGGAGAGNGYIVDVTSNETRIALIQNHNYTTLGSVSFNFESETWYWVRFQVRGTSQKLKIWSGDDSDQPEAWMVETNDSTITDAGWVGIGRRHSSNSRTWDVFAVGTGTDDATLFPEGEPDTDATWSQSTTEILSSGEPEAGWSQSAVEALILQHVDSLWSQASIEVMTRNVPTLAGEVKVNFTGYADMAIPGALEAHGQILFMPRALPAVTDGEGNPGNFFLFF